MERRIISDAATARRRPFDAEPAARRYGDISPATSSGRAIAIVVMIVGIGFLTLLIGAAAERFVSMGVEPIAEAEETLATTEAEMLYEVGEIRDRLARLEASIRRL
jgi:hypothetical protein